MSAYNCIDVSEHNREIDWGAARQDGVEYAFIRCGFGRDTESQDDKYFIINMEDALAAGVKVGVYFYSYATDVDAARSEAEHCIRLITPYRDKLSLPVFYDVEEDKIAPYIEDTIPTFIDALNEAGYNCGVYCTTWWFDTYFKPIACSYFWLASWGNDDGEPHKKPEWCDVWQYTSRGRVNGLDGYVDCNILYNEDMTALINKPEPTPEPTPSDKVTVELDVLKRGATGGQVQTIQALLNGFGFRDEDGDELAIDGIYGQHTEYAVRAYQAARDLTVDGVVGSETWTRILK